MLHKWIIFENGTNGLLCSFRAIRKPHGVSIRKGVIYEGELSPAVRRSGYFDAFVDIDRLLRD